MAHTSKEDEELLRREIYSSEELAKFIINHYLKEEHKDSHNAKAYEAMCFEILEEIFLKA